MRRARTFVAATAIAFAGLGIAVPAAHADSHTSDSSSNSSGSDKSWSGSDGGSWSGKESGKESDHKKAPHGGPHAGIGILDEGAGLATGGVLIAGGLGLGVYALRRRTSSGLAGA